MVGVSPRLIAREISRDFASFPFDCDTLARELVVHWEE